MNSLLLLSIFATVAYMLYIVFDGPRRFESMQSLINTYAKKPAFNKRVVVVIRCGNKLSMTTLRSILAQSTRVNDIAIETRKPDSVPPEVRAVVTIHKPETTKLRETEEDTVVIFVENGKWYDYDFIEETVKTVRASRN
jgi:hypothetical protein